MKNLMRPLIIILGLLFLPVAMALDTNSLEFQVIQSQMIFDSSTIESATISPLGNDFYGVNLKLKAAASNQLNALTEVSIGKRANLIFNGTVISSPTIQSKLGGEFLITGFNEEQAQQFIKSLNFTN